MPENKKNGLLMIAAAGIGTGVYLLTRKSKAPEQPETPAETPPAPVPETPLEDSNVIEELMRQLEEARRLLEELRADNAELQRRIEEAQEVLEDQDKTLANLDADISRLTELVAKLQSNASDLERQIAEAQALLTTLRQQNEQLRTETSNAQYIIGQQAATISELERVIAGLQATIEQLKIRIAELEQLVAQAARNLAAAREQNEQLRQLIASLQQTIAQQQQQIAQLEQTIAQLEELSDVLLEVVDYFRFRQDIQRLSEQLGSIDPQRPENLGGDPLPDEIVNVRIPNIVARMRSQLPAPESRQPVNWPTVPDVAQVSAPSGVVIKVQLFALPFDQRIKVSMGAWGHTATFGWSWGHGGAVLFSKERILMYLHKTHMGGVSQTKEFDLPAGAYGLLAYAAGNGRGGANAKVEYVSYGR